MTGWLERVPAEWEVVSPRRHFQERREPSRPDDVHLTPSQHHGVLPQAEYMEVSGSRVVLNLTGVDNMKHVEPGDTIGHLRSFQGGLETSPLPGKVSNAYTVIRPGPSASHLYFRWVFKSAAFVQELAAHSQSLRDGQSVKYEDLASIDLPMPPLDDQRRIADFLDDRVSRLDRIIAARSEQVTLLSESRSRLSYDVVRGATVPGARRDSRLDWLGDIPTTWGVLSVGSQFTVELGKMLDDKRQSGAHSLPYLRNTNVQWDEISVDDLKEMDIPDTEYARYTVKTGDLLICEGGQPGRSAIWEGGVEPLGFQKALHRARSRGHSTPGWLLECLRVAVDLDVFAEASGQTTIAHLTNEQLRGQRFPFPDRDVQDSLLDDLEESRRTMTSIIKALDESVDLLIEYKSSLITAAVTGELDVSTAGSSIPG